MDFIFYIVALLATGAMVGFASGLLGVGGGFIMVPVQFFLLTSIGVDPTTAIRVAFGTSLAVILPTAISGAFGHKRRGAVLTKPMTFMGISGIIGAFIGGTLASNIPGMYLRTIFGFMVLMAGVWMLIAKYPEIGAKPGKGALNYLIIGFVAGILSGLLGIGGGIVLVPYSNYNHGIQHVQCRWNIYSSYNLHIAWWNYCLYIKRGKHYRTPSLLHRIYKYYTANYTDSYKYSNSPTGCKNFT